MVETVSFFNEFQPFQRKRDHFSLNLLWALKTGWKRSAFSMIGISQDVDDFFSEFSLEISKLGGNGRFIDCIQIQ
jgi:hypothetical protein